MAISNRTATVGNSGAASVASVDVNKPTGTAAGDFLLAVVSTSIGSSQVISTPSGWTAVTTNNQSTNIGQYIFSRVADGSESSPFTFALAASTARLSVVCNAYTGVDPNNPVAGFGSRSTATASTTITYAAATPQAESVYPVLIESTRNTTAAATMTASSGYTVDGTTSTTATPFIGAYMQDQHTAIGLPLAALTPGTTTSSQSVSYSVTTLFLRPDISTTTTPVVETIGLTSISGATTATVTSTTGYATAYVVQVNVGGGGSPPTGVANTSGLSWTKAVAHNTSNPTEIWVAYSATPLSADVVTVTWAGATTARVLVSTVKNTASSPIGAAASGTAVSQSLTTTATNSLPFWTITYLTYSAGTAATSNTIVEQAVVITTTGESRGHYTAVVPTASSVTLGLSAPTGKTYDTVAVEILALTAPTTNTTNFFQFF